MGFYSVKCSTGILLPAFLLLACSLIQAQNDWNSLPPLVAGKTDLMKQHYGKLGFVVLDDTCRTECCEGPLWVVLGKTVIPRTTRLTIPEGTRLLFEPSASLLVDGTLVVKGTPGAPVEFMAVPLSERYAVIDSNDILWNGITVSSTGKLDMKHAAIRDASRGIVSDGPCDSMLLSRIEFANVTGTVFAHSEGKPKVALDMPFTNSCSADIATGTPRSERHFRIASNVLFASAGVAALAAAALYGTAYYSDQQVHSSTTREEAQKVYDSATRLYGYGGAAGIAAGTCALGGLGFRLAFTFGKGK